MKEADSFLKSLVESQREVLEIYSKYIAERFKELGSGSSEKEVVSLASLQEKLFKNLQIFLQIQEQARQRPKANNQLELDFDRGSDIFFF